MTIVLMQILCGAEIDIFVPSFPDLQHAFHLSPFMVELTLAVNLTAHCLTSLIVGNLGDRYGRRPIILLGLLIFTIGSIFCIFSTAYWHLLFGRLWQGAGISGAAVLSYLVIADMYSAQRQQQLMGTLNGALTLAMAFAPVVGSFVNMYYSWQGNFVVLLLLSLLCLGLGIVYLPKGVKNSEVTFSLKEYVPVLRSKKAFYYIASIVLSLQVYWIFIGMSPILYMEDLGVSLKEFGFYQGALAAVFSVGSFSSGFFLRKYGQKKCFFFGVSMMVVFMVLMPVLILFNVKDPLIITGVMLFQSIGIILPINILWPLMLESIPGAKGRLAAVVVAGRLIVTALSLQLASYFYDGTLRSLAVIMGLFMVSSLWVGYKLLKVDQIFVAKDTDTSSAQVA
ncbi:MAG: MFS transporter [Alphaproteobacteria bacterium]|nr:MFS transporter [Alphaproteobacteria bacterium]